MEVPQFWHTGCEWVSFWSASEVAIGINSIQEKVKRIYRPKHGVGGELIETDREEEDVRVAVIRSGRGDLIAGRGAIRIFGCAPSPAITALGEKPEIKDCDREGKEEKKNRKEGKKEKEKKRRQKRKEEI